MSLTKGSLASLFLPCLCVAQAFAEIMKQTQLNSHQVWIR